MTSAGKRRLGRGGVLAASLLVVSARAAFGYIGPGAGFAFASSFLVFLIAFLLAAAVFITSPVRLVVRLLRRRRRSASSRCDRVIVVGLDGMSPDVAERMMEGGELPNFKRLAQGGSFSRLRSTTPSASPVAWSTFQTGVNPGKHNIFDFLTRDKQTYLPDLSSARIEPPRRTLKLGKLRMPLGKPRVTGMRKSRPFWKALGEHGLFSIVLRVPITFPPEKFNGVMLSGMCVPDLRGTQGSFTYFTTDGRGDAEHTGGTRIMAERDNDAVRCALPGPANPMDSDGSPMETEFRVVPQDGDTARLELNGRILELKRREFSPWVHVTFKAGPGASVSGICRFYLLETEPEFRLYVTPINIDPEKPALPLSHPFVYSSYLARVFGPYATLGLAEDTWALNEDVLGEKGFLDLAYSIHEEREKMFFDALGKVDQGAVVCVFDITDRVQHMFWRYTPEARAAGSDPGESDYADAVEQVYRRMDDMLGRVTERLDEDDVLIVMSDHGFGSFRRGVNLNAWLWQNGFLTLKDGADGCAGYFQSVDWSRTKAYAVGLGGIFLNQVGRESQGIVEPGEESETVKRQIIEGLTELVDEQKAVRPVRRVIDGAEVYSGPYAENGPDLVAGCANGYRTSWDSVTGKFGTEVIEINEKAWAGDHCVDPELVPGVLFCNRGLGRGDPGIIDLAPTVLDLFGVAVPGYMDGRPLMPREAEEAAPETEKVMQDA